MPNVTVLVVEVSNAAQEQEGSLNKNKTNSSGKSLTAGAVGGGAVVATAGITAVGGAITKEDYSRVGINLKEGTGLVGGTYHGVRQRGIYSKYKKLAMTGSRVGPIKRAERMAEVDTAKTAKQYSNASFKNAAKALPGVATGSATAAAAVYSVYSNYQKAGLEMAGSSHAAAIQARKGEAANSLTQIGVAALVNPVLAAGMIAMKAWQQAQTNRKQLFDIQKSQIQSAVLQKNLVKNVAERRF